LEVLERAHRQNPTDRDALIALIPIARDIGDAATALLYARELSWLSPMDTQVRTMVLDLEKNHSQQ
jgi:hypothetical protein